jgi:hypothetical protein
MLYLQPFHSIGKAFGFNFYTFSNFYKFIKILTAIPATGTAVSSCCLL